MKTTKGIWSDNTLNDQPEGYLVFAKNLLLTEKLGVLQNEPGFLKYASIPGKTAVGVIAIQDDLVFWNIDNTTSASEIGILSNGVYTVVINDSMLQPAGSKFNFDVNHPIRAEFYKNYKSQRLVAWVEDNNIPRILNLDNPSFQISDLSLFPSADLALPVVQVAQTGGAAACGVYSVIYRYEDDDGTLSSYSAPSKPVSIIAAPSSTGYDNYNQSILQGSAPGTSSGKGITITIPVIDSNWSFVHFAVIQTVNSVTTVFEFKKLSCKGVSSLTTLYTGSETTTTLTLAEVLTPAAYYTGAGAIGQLNNRLYLGNLTAETDPLLQQYCLNIKLQWTSSLWTAPYGGLMSQAEEASGTEQGAFAHGEVYAFYIQFRNTKTGLWTKGYHIPGKARATWNSLYSTVQAPGPSGTYLSGSNSPTFQNYQLEDSGIGNVTGSGNVYSGDLGVWANQNETYPDTPEYDATSIGGLNYRGQPVVHHKFPTLGYMKNNVYTSGAYPSYGNSTIDNLGLNVSNVNLPPDLAALYSSWRICYAKRTLGDATVLSVSQIYFYGYGRESLKMKPNSANATCGLASNDFIDFGGNSYPTGYKGCEFIRFHGFNTQVDLPAVAPVYLRSEWKITYNSWQSIASPNSQTTPLVDFRLFTDCNGQNGMLRKYSLFAPFCTNGTVSAISTSYRFRNVKFVQYLPTGAIVTVNGTLANTIDNRAGESCMLLQQNIAGMPTATVNNRLDLYIGNLGAPSNSSWPTNNRNIYEDFCTNVTTLCSLCALKTDVYSGFYSRELVATDQEFIKSGGVLPSSSAGASNGRIMGGDTWAGWHSVTLQGPQSDERVAWDGGTGGEIVAGANLLGYGQKSVAYFLAESYKNLNYRYKDTADNQSTFYPATGLIKTLQANYTDLFLGIMDLFKAPVYKYNADYNTLNSTGESLLAYNPYTITVSAFPTTIAASQTVSDESVIVSWKNFLSSDRYTMPRNKGKIINIQGVANQRLYIHMENTLFITKDRMVLQTTTTDVTIGSGSIFDVTPYEVAYSESGYAGTQHKFGCVLTKLGYVFMDMSQGKVFLHNGESLEEISKNGTRQFWRDFTTSTSIADNPFQGNGVTVGYDELYNRLIFTWKDKTNNNFITASYSPQLQAWCSYHDYNPDYLLSVRNNKLYSIKNQNGNVDIFRHNAGPYGMYYNTTSPYPMLADIVHNKDPYDTKYFSSVSWISLSTNGNAVNPTDTVNYLTLHSLNKTTDRILIAPYQNITDSYNSNSRLTERSWSYNQIRNIAKEPLGNDTVTLDFYNNFNVNSAILATNIDWYDKARFVDNFMVVRFEYSNLNNNKFMIQDHDVEFRKSFRA